MDKIDQTYLTNLVIKAQKGSSNAFAELFVAAYESHYLYVQSLLEDPALVTQALKDIYVQIYHQLPGLVRPVLYLPWSCRICYRHCCEILQKDPERTIVTRVGTYAAGALLRLPLTESQVLLMRYEQQLSVKQVADILNFDRNVLKRCLKSAEAHLRKSSEDGKGGRMSRSRAALQTGKHIQPLKKKNLLEPTEILQHVFTTTGCKPNTVPLEALEAYAVYRKERFSLQKGITAFALLLFLLLPLLFILPDFEVWSQACGERGLPVYYVHVNSFLPVGRVQARVRAHNLPVYEASAHDYSVEPTRNGTLTIEVELINRQKQIQELEVTDVDAKGPELTGSQIEADQVILKVADEGIGIDYGDVYAQEKDGTLHKPLSSDPETGEIVFEYPREEWDVYIPDYIGNLLHLTFTFES